MTTEQKCVNRTDSENVTDSNIQGNSGGSEVDPEKNKAEAEQIIKLLSSAKWFARIMDDDHVSPDIKEKIWRGICVYIESRCLEKKDPGYPHSACIGFQDLPEYVSVLVRASLLKIALLSFYLSACYKSTNIESLLWHTKRRHMILFTAILGENAVAEVFAGIELVFIESDEMTKEERTKRFLEFLDKCPGSGKGVYTIAGIIGKIKSKFGDMPKTQEFDITCTSDGIIEVSIVGNAALRTFLGRENVPRNYNGQKYAEWLDRVICNSKYLSVDKKTGTLTVKPWAGVAYKVKVPSPESCVRRIMFD
jgi:hypothetical protein